LKSISKQAPEFEDIDGWINSWPLTLQQLKGKVVFLDFWTYGCINCQRTLPHTSELDAKYRREGLVVVGVHTPEFPFERKRENVERAVSAAGLTYPIALDSKNSTWKLYGNHYWPRQTIIDASGVVRYEHIGEGGYDEIETMVLKLLNESKHFGRAAAEEATGYSPPSNEPGLHGEEQRASTFDHRR
jgi:thiol-disulfide isomerase/thioredoxin